MSRLILVSALAVIVGCASAAAQPVPAVRLSVSTAGTQANGLSQFLSLSDDGRHVLFLSFASNLVDGDTNLATDLFVRDRDTDRDGILDEQGAVQTVRVSVGPAGQQGQGAIIGVRMTRDGRFVLFTITDALVAEDTNGVDDVYLRDRDSDGDGIFDEPDAVTTTRVSTGTGNVQGEAASASLTITENGRFIGFRSMATTFNVQPGAWPQLYVKDRQTGVLTVVSTLEDGTPAPRDISYALAISPDGRYAALANGFAPLLGGGGDPAYANHPWILRNLATGDVTFVATDRNAARALPSRAPSTVSPLIVPFSSPEPGFSPDGRTIYMSEGAAYFFPTSYTGVISEVDVETGRARRTVSGFGVARFLYGTDDGPVDDTIVFPEAALSTCPGGGIRREATLRYDPRTGRVTRLLDVSSTEVFRSANGERLLYRGGLCSIPDLQLPVALLDQTYGVPLPMPDPVRAGRLDAAGTMVVFTSAEDTIVGPTIDTNGEADVFAVDLTSRLDRDSDGLDDRWEVAMGLDYTSATGVDGAAGDPDSDGQTNAQELAAGTHPRGTQRLLLAEGADNAFFSTRFALANPGTTDATAAVRLDGDDGSSRTVSLLVPAGGRRTLFVDELGAPAASFATSIEANAPIAADRTMSWDHTGYGAHAERASASASQTWFLAEGATGAFSLFYLLQNPGDTPATVTIRYLRPAPRPPIERVYELPPHVRLTLPVQQQAPELADTDVSAAITATEPILVERAMYRSVGSQPFAAGHGSAAVPAASTSWFLAEGATGDFFDLFVLLANPNTSPADVEIRYLLPGGTVLTKTYVVAPESRRTIWVDGEDFPGLGQALVNTTPSCAITSTNGVPIVVERSMWFPGPAVTPVFWTEAHNSAGATSTATRWVLADGESGGSRGARTFVLIANTSATPGRVRVTTLPETPSSPLRLLQFTRTIDLPPHSRTTVPMHEEDGTSDRRFGVLVESIDTAPLAELVVERAMYWDAGGVTWAAGTNLLATPIP